MYKKYTLLNRNNKKKTMKRSNKSCEQFWFININVCAVLKMF